MTGQRCSLSLTTERPLSPGCLISSTPSYPGSDTNTKDTQNEYMYETIDLYVIEQDVPRRLGRQSLEEERHNQCCNRDVIFAEDSDNGWEKPDID